MHTIFHNMFIPVVTRCVVSLSGPVAAPLYVSIETPVQAQIIIVFVTVADRLHQSNAYNAKALKPYDASINPFPCYRSC